MIIYTNITSKNLHTMFATLLRPLDVAFESFEKGKNLQKKVFLLDSSASTPSIFHGIDPTSTVIFLGKIHPTAPQIKNFYVLEKPFKTSQFTLLLKKVMRHSFAYKEITLDFDARILRDRKTNNISYLTEKEAKLLLSLFQAQGHPVERSKLLEKVWGYKSDLETQTLETHLYRLKKKLKSSLGYSLVSTNTNGYFVNTEEN
jgi:DNA-binding winged helix-turn-helix (wHTH) protein